MTVISDTQIVPRPPPSLPELRAADRGVADALEAVLADNTRRVYAAQRARFDLALVAFLSDGGLRRSEAAALTWGDVQRWDDGSGRITVIRSKTDVEAAGAPWWLSPPAAMRTLDAVRPVGVGSSAKVFGLSKSQIARRIKSIAQGRRLSELGVLQRSQREGGHGPAHGPKRRAHPRDRTPGPLEAGRRHGRPLHPRRIRRFGSAVSITHIRLKSAAASVIF